MSRQRFNIEPVVMEYKSTTRFESSAHILHKLCETKRKKKKRHYHRHNDYTLFHDDGTQGPHGGPLVMFVKMMIPQVAVIAVLLLLLLLFLMLGSLIIQWSMIRGIVRRQAVVVRWSSMHRRQIPYITRIPRIHRQDRSKSRSSDGRTQESPC